MTLASLPPELLSRIASFAGSFDLSSLRLTNRELHEKLQFDYDRRVLSQRWLFSEASIRTLVKVARSPRFQDRLTDFRISTLFIYYVTWEAKTVLWERYHEEQEAFKASDRPAACLTVALMAMPKLRTIEVGQWCRPHERLQLGWGGKTVARIIEEPLEPTQCDEDRDEDGTLKNRQKMTIIFNALLTALSVTERQIEKLSARLLTPFNGKSRPELDGIEVSMIQPKSKPLWRGLRVALSCLKQLELAVRYEKVRKSSKKTNDGWKYWLPQFVSLAPCLGKL
jgi:hypothetical protein